MNPRSNVAHFSVSVVVPARNAAATLSRCLASLGAQTYPAALLEILVVDDGSRDATAAIARAAAARVLSQPPRGPAAARNLGARHSDRDLVLFTDADCMPERTWVARMVAPFDDPEVVATKGSYLTDQRALVARFAQAEYEEKYERMRRFESIDFVDTYSAAYRRDRFVAVGGFDERYPTAANEDLDLSFRLALQGARMLFVPEARVHHHHPTSLLAYARRKFRVGRWKPILHADHPERARHDTHTPPTLRPQVGLAAIAALTAASSIALASVVMLGPPGPGRRAAASLGRAASVAAAGCLAAHTASTLPFAARLAPRDPALAIAAPLFLLIRSLALAAGYAVGTVALEPARRRPGAGSTSARRSAERS